MSKKKRTAQEKAQDLVADSLVKGFRSKEDHAVKEAVALKEVQKRMPKIKSVHIPFKPGAGEQREQIGTAYVDSGQLMIIDPCYAKNVDYEYCMKETWGQNPPYDERDPKEEIKLGLGAVSNTRDGDGAFPVYKVFQDGVLVALEVRFDFQP